MKTILLLSMLMSFFSLGFAKQVSISIDGKNLRGELFGDDRSRAVFILSGSGPTDRDGNTVGAAGKNNSLKYLSDALNKAGMTTLRVDKRGVGKSANAALKESDLRFSTYVEDVAHWIEFLEKQGYSKIVLVGHSEGALVATLAASHKSVTHLVCIAGAGRAAPVVLREQLKPKLPKDLYAQADQIISSLTEGKTVKDSPASLSALFRLSVQPYLISWFKVDPAKAISTLKVPILIVQGSTDVQVSAKDAKLLHEAAKGGDLIVIEGMNHVLKAVEGDLAAQMPSYFNPNLPLHKDLPKCVIKFLETTNTEQADGGNQIQR